MVTCRFESEMKHGASMSGAYGIRSGEAGFCVACSVPCHVYRPVEELDDAARTYVLRRPTAATGGGRYFLNGLL